MELQTASNLKSFDVLEIYYHPDLLLKLHRGFTTLAISISQLEQGLLTSKKKKVAKFGSGEGGASSWETILRQ